MIHPKPWSWKIHLGPKFRLGPDGTTDFVAASRSLKWVTQRAGSGYEIRQHLVMAGAALLL